MKYPVLLLSIASISGCVTMSGNFTVTGTKPDGSPIPTTISAQGSGIYSARNSFCLAYPGATVKIVDAKTGKEYASESPYKCK
jgi:hypothetical protein